MVIHRATLPQKILILSDIRSVHNVGSLLRTADSIGIDMVYCTGYTPTPFDRFGRIRSDIAKVALGAENTVPCEAHSSLTVLMDSLREQGVTLVAVEQHASSQDYKTYTPTYPIALILGNEPLGLSQESIEKSDVCLEIPQYGSKESLNVAVAGGIILYRLFDR